MILHRYLGAPGAPGAAEDAHVEATTGDQIRAALRPFLAHLRDVSPGRAGECLADATGGAWVSHFYAPVRFGWTGRRYPDPIAEQIVKLLSELDELQHAAAIAFRATLTETP